MPAIGKGLGTVVATVLAVVLLIDSIDMFPDFTGCQAATAVWRESDSIKRELEIGHYKRTEALGSHSGDQELLPFSWLPWASRSILCAMIT